MQIKEEIPNNALELQAQAQVEYIKVLLEKAENKALVTSPEWLAFDLQGRLLTNVTLNSDDIKRIINAINTRNKTKYLPNQQGLEAALGRKNSETTVVSLDIAQKGLEPLQEHYKNVLHSYGVTDKQFDVLNSSPKGSIIALQQEYHFHLGLTARLYEKKINHYIPTAPLDPSIMEEAHASTMIRVNSLIMKVYANALKEATGSLLGRFGRGSGKINLLTLNQALDKARAGIMQDAHVILAQEVQKRVSLPMNMQGLKKEAESTTATANDVLHVNAAQGVVTLIAGSEETAHNRKFGKDFAKRQLITHTFDQSGQIVTNQNGRIQIRTPSPVVKKYAESANETDEKIIDDVRDKFQAVKDEYKLADYTTKQGKRPAAFIYNSLTAINDTLGDRKGNLQTESAIHILEGMHKYNASQLDAAQKPPVYCFVQNISVNHRGDSLGYGFFSALRNETTLMAEIAMLHTLYDTATVAECGIIDGVFDKYQQYLEGLQKSELKGSFYESDFGPSARDQIELLKGIWKKNPQATASDNPVVNAKYSLRQLMANNFHFQHRYSKTFQALSVFIEKVSISGCKSGNERTQAVNGRVAVLDAVVANHTHKADIAIVKALANLSTSKSGDIKTTSTKLKRVIEERYDTETSQQAASLISNLDQGAAPKLKSRTWSAFTDSNQGESANMKYLSQAFAKCMQAHHKLTVAMRKAWAEVSLVNNRDIDDDIDFGDDDSEIDDLDDDVDDSDDEIEDAGLKSSKIRKKVQEIKLDISKNDPTSNNSKS